MALGVLRSNVLNQCIRKFSSESKLVSISVNDKNGVATVSLQRPPVNSLNLELIRDFSGALDELEKNKCRGMILTSSSPTVFCAGLDILEMYQPKLDRVTTWWKSLQDMWVKLYGSSYPTAAAINGHSPAGGCLISMCCEYRVMVRNYTIGLNETQLGIVAPQWFIATMKNTIGHRQAEMALTLGRLFKTDEALAIGLVDEAVGSKEEALQRAESFLEKFARIPSQARTITKQFVRGETIENMVKSREDDLKSFLGTVQNDQVQKGLGMYLDSLKNKQ